MKILLAIAISFTLQTTLVFSQTPSIQEMWFGKTAFYQQIGDKNPVLDPSHPYAFSSKCIINGGKLISASITSNDISYKYTKTGDNKSDIFSLFKTNEDLTSCFPSGNYTLQVISSNGSISEIINNENPFYPSPPRILSGNNTCWINEVLVITSNKTDATFSWTSPNEQIDGIWVSDENGGNTFPSNHTSYTLSKSYIDSLPFDTPIYHLVQFNAYLGNSATTFYIYKPSPLNNDNFLLLTKIRTFLQNSNNTPSDWSAKKEAVFFNEYGPYSFSIESSQPQTITAPNSTAIYTQEAWIDNYRFNSGPIATKTALDQAYPDGNYTVGNQTIKFIGSIYPNNLNPIKILKVNGKTPVWENGKLVIDSKIRNLIEWTPLSIKSKTKYEISFDVHYIDGFQENLINIERGSFKDNKKLISSFSIPPNSMKNTNDYFLSIKYYNYCLDSRARYGICTFAWLAPK